MGTKHNRPPDPPEDDDDDEDEGKKEEPKPDPRDEELKTLRAANSDIATKFATLQGRFEESTKRAAPAPAAPRTPDPIEDIDDDTLDAALTEGRSGIGKLVRKVASAERQRAERASASRIDALEAKVNAVVQGGSEVTARVARMDMPYYDYVKDDMEEALKNPDIDPFYKANLSNHKVLHDLMTGRNIDKIVKAEVEKALRGASDESTKVPTAVGGRAGREIGDKTVPTAMEVFGAGHAREIRNKGGEDAIAIKMGYRSWAHYLEATEVEGEA